jgi:hypothetical protein
MNNFKVAALRVFKIIELARCNPPVSAFKNNESKVNILKNERALVKVFGFGVLK